MREGSRNKQRLQSIIDAVDILQKGVQRFSVEQAENDIIIFGGFAKQIEIIGDSVHMLTKEFKEEHPEVEWNAMERMLHDKCNGITPEKVWKTVTNYLPELKKAIEPLITAESSRMR